MRNDECKNTWLSDLPKLGAENTVAIIISPISHLPPSALFIPSSLLPFKRIVKGTEKGLWLPVTSWPPIK